APGGGRHHADAAEFGDDGELGAQLPYGVRPLGGVEVADEVRHVHAHGGHDHAVGPCLPQLLQPPGEVEVALAAQLDGVEAGLHRELELLLQGAAGQHLLLNGQFHDELPENRKTSWSTSAGRRSSISNASAASWASTTWLTRPAVSTSPRSASSMKVRCSRSTSQRWASQEATAPIWEETSCTWLWWNSSPSRRPIPSPW